jgi:hypothetical protein
MKKVKEKMKTGNWVRKVVVVGLLVLLMVVGNTLLKKLSPSPVASAIEESENAKKVMKNLVSGCIMRGLENPELVPIIMFTQGNVCLQILGDTIASHMQGNGVCSSSDEACLFKVGYVSTAVLTVSDELSSEEKNVLEEQADVALTKFLEESGQ